MTAASTGKGLEVTPGYNVDMKYNADTEMVDFTFVLPDNTWFGFGLGSKDMFDVNMI